MSPSLSTSRQKGSLPPPFPHLFILEAGVGEASVLTPCPHLFIEPVKQCLVIPRQSSPQGLASRPPLKGESPAADIHPAVAATPL